jgi:glycosyltransferase involved in cell wall biosynthesis
MLLIIDATSVSLRLTGIERYATEIIKDLVSMAANDGYSVTLLTSRDVSVNELTSFNHPACTIQSSPFHSRLLTEQVWIPWILCPIKKAVCFFPAFPPSPLINFFRFKKRIIKTVFDAVMWRHPETISWKNKLYMKPLESYWMSRYDRIHTISNFSMQEITGLFPATKNKVTNSGIGCNYRIFTSDHGENSPARLIKRYELPKEFIFFVGTLEPRKNLVFLLEIICLLKDKIPDIRLVIAGRSGWGADALFKCVTERQLAENVIFLGAVSDKDLPILYSLATIFVFPSLYEGFGLPVVEAMAAGTPVIASHAASIPEAAGDAAVLLPPDNAALWRDAVYSLLQDADRRNDLIKKGYQQAQKFSWQDVSRKILESL